MFIAHNLKSRFFEKPEYLRERSGTHTATYEITDALLLKMDDKKVISVLLFDLTKAFEQNFNT